MFKKIKQRSNILQRLDRIDALLILILKRGILMEQRVVDLLARIDTATNDIAAKIQTLIDTAAEAGHLSSEEIANALDPLVDNLEALASDPENPVPGV